MIFALREPAVLLGILVGFLVAVVLRAALQRRLAAGRRPLRVAGRPGGRGWRPRLGWGGYLDPYGTVAAVLSGVGWGTRPASRRTGVGSDLGFLVAALVVHAALAAVGFALFDLAGGPVSLVHLVPVSDVLHGHVDTGDLAENVTLGFAMVNVGCGLLALVPIPPLELGLVLWHRLPRSPGARRLAYRLVEEQWGVAAVLLLLLLPLAGQQPPLLALIDAVADPLLSLM